MSKNIFVFPDTDERDVDVIVAVPKYHRIGNKRYEIYVREKDIDVDPPHEDARIAINFEIYYVDNEGDQILYDIRPHFEMWVGYKESEKYYNLLKYVSSAEDKDRPDNMRWTPLGHSKGISPHPDPSDPKYTGYGYARESEWGDPNVGWG